MIPRGKIYRRSYPFCPISLPSLGVARRSQFLAPNPNAVLAGCGPSPVTSFPFSSNGWNPVRIRLIAALLAWILHFEDANSPDLRKFQLTAPLLGTRWRTASPIPAPRYLPHSSNGRAKVQFLTTAHCRLLEASNSISPEKLQEIRLVI